jgi:hypothetical protein
MTIENLAALVRGQAEELGRLRTELQELRRVPQPERQVSAPLAEPDGSVSRRRLLGKAGIAAAGAAIGSAVLARPAHADNGDSLILGERENRATNTTEAVGAERWTFLFRDGHGFPVNWTPHTGVVVGLSVMGFPGVRGHSSIWGVIGTTSGTGVSGVLGQSTTGGGVWGDSQSSTGTIGSSVSGIGVYGESRQRAGVLGRSGTNWPDSPSDPIAGVHGAARAGAGVYGSCVVGDGVRGQSSSKTGVFGTTSAAPSSTLGPNAGVVGFSVTAHGVVGTSRDAPGVRGDSTNATALHGRSTNGYGVEATGGRAAIRLVPRSTAGAPASGTHQRGEMVCDANGVFWGCTAGSTSARPQGTWKRLSAP